MLSIDELRRKLQLRLQSRKSDFTHKSIHYAERPLDKATELLIGPNAYPVERESYLVVIDEAPGAFWTHPVSYELHETETGEVTVIHEQYPLESPNLEVEMVALHIPDIPGLLPRKEDRDLPEPLQVEVGRLEKILWHKSFDLPRPCTAHRHALFVAGVDNMPHFHDDFLIMRDVLLETYGYRPDNIVIVLGDGSDYADLPVDYPGTIVGLDDALDSYRPGGSRELGADDHLFLFGFNHGGIESGDAYLCMHPAWTPKYYDHQLRAKLDDIHCGDLIVAMNQCHSGGFIDDVLASTGPGGIAIMTACRSDQSAYPATGGGSHGYLAAALATALNWAFPAGVGATFPGHAVGTVSAQDNNLDGRLSAEEAWLYVHDMMHAHHWHTINGIETPQWGTSTPTAGAALFWGQPNLVVADGSPFWESPDVYLHNPATVPTDATAVTWHPDNWNDDYRPDMVNRVVCRVHNTGCAPCRNTSVEFRAMSFGVGGGTTLIGTAGPLDIDPGQHTFAWVDWNFSSALSHRCIMVRADSAGDPAMPFGGNIVPDDNQAQRNVDPLYLAPYFAEPLKRAVELEQTFLIQNLFDVEARFVGDLAMGERSPEIEEIDTEPLEALGRKVLQPQQAQRVKMRMKIRPRARLGKKFRFPIQIKSLQPEEQILGGVTLTVEIAAGRLEGQVVRRTGRPGKGRVVLEGLKQKEQKHSARVRRSGRFSFKHIAPGPYRIWAECKEGVAQSTVFVEKNTVTRKILMLEEIPRLVHGRLDDVSGEPLADTLIAARDAETGVRYLARTDSHGDYTLAGAHAGEFEITVPGESRLAPRTLRLDETLTEEPEVATQRAAVLEEAVLQEV
ncbi:MAG: hypothetical protein GY719_22550 [bacterium]|nr:hypothetical protein [bacterium]